MNISPATTQQVLEKNPNPNNTDPSNSTCQWCGKQFNTHQGKNAHLQFCVVAKEQKVRHHEAGVVEAVAPVAVAVADEPQQPETMTTATATTVLQEQHSTQGVERMTNGEQPTKQKKKKITTEQKEACFDFFVTRKFILNSSLPKGAYDQEFNDFRRRHDLSKDQVGRQLKQWKLKKYSHWGDTYNKNEGEMKNIILAHMPENTSEFLQSIIDKMTNMSLNSDESYIWYTAAATENVYVRRMLPKMMNAPFLEIFIAILNSYVDIAVKVFPKQAKRCGDSDVKFYDLKKDMVDEKFKEEFYGKVQQLDEELNLAENLSEETKERKRYLCWKVLYLQLEEKMYHEWCRLSYETNLPPIQIVLSEKGIGRYSDGILYYTAGCILKGIVNATARKNKTTRFFRHLIAEDHVITLANAELHKLPYKLTQRKDTQIRRKLTYASGAFYEFVCVLENTFLANANIKMMIAHNKGDLFDSIVMALYSEPEVVALFRKKITDDAEGDSITEDQIKILLLDVLTRFKHIRGSWFIRNIKGQQKLASPHATRKQIQVKSEIALATNDVRTQQTMEAFYEDALSNIQKDGVDLDQIVVEDAEDGDS